MNAAEFSSRLASVIGDESVRQFAIRCGLSDSVIHGYLGGDRTPNVEPLTRISVASGVNLDWLVFGDDGLILDLHTPRSAEPPSAPDSIVGADAAVIDVFGDPCDTEALDRYQIAGLTGIPPAQVAQSLARLECEGRVCACNARVYRDGIVASVYELAAYDTGADPESYAHHARTGGAL